MWEQLEVREDTVNNDSGHFSSPTEVVEWKDTFFKDNKELLEWLISEFNFVKLPFDKRYYLRTAYVDFVSGYGNQLEWLNRQGSWRRIDAQTYERLSQREQNNASVLLELKYANDDIKLFETLNEAVGYFEKELENIDTILTGQTYIDALNQEQERFIKAYPKSNLEHHSSNNKWYTPAQTNAILSSFSEWVMWNHLALMNKKSVYTKILAKLKLLEKI